MSPRVSRSVPSRSAGASSQQRKIVFEVDLNIPLYDHSQSNDVGASEHASDVHDVQARQQRPTPSPVTIDVDSIDDDVVLCSPRAFAEAKNNSRRSRSRSNVVDVELDGIEISNRDTANIRSKRRRVLVSQPVINVNEYGENMPATTRYFFAPLATPPPPLPPPPPPPEPTFTCPVCIGPLVEETSTKCGHIFCKMCIKTAIAIQHKCPTCRRKTTPRDTFRIYLPKTSS